MPHEEKTITIPATDGRTIEELKAAEDYQEFTIEKVQVTKNGGISITTTDSTGFGIGAEDLQVWKEARNGGKGGTTLDHLPTKGMTGRLYPKSPFGQIHGIDLDGTEVYWKTPAEREADRAVWLANYDREQREEFAAEKGKLDADYEALPDPLKKRIDRFRAEDEGFRITSESYELFTCVEAAKFLAKAQVAALVGDNAGEVDAFWASKRDPDKVWGGERPDEYAAAWLLWVWTLDNERQADLIDYSHDHSGNTFGGAMMLAVRLAMRQEV